MEKYFCYADGLREFGLFSLKRRRLQEDLFVAIQNLKGACKKDGDNFLVGPVEIRQAVMVLNYKIVNLY